ncbi:MAG: DUF4080 domain-containing protein [Clostridia bacterium]|nr:DUF4080 domain-containing protein [Clostridia bacterium]
MDVLILALNSKYIHSSLAPWYLQSAIRDLAVDSLVLEHTINEKCEDILADVLVHKPKIFALSVYIWNVKMAYVLAKQIKVSLPTTKIIFGGPEVGYNPEEVLTKCPSVDYVIGGEGEEPFLALCKHLLLRDVCGWKGISRRYEKKIFVSEPYIGTGTPKSPYTDRYFHALQGRIAYFESSRGCPYSCAYCLSGRCEGMRFFDMTYVKENLLKLAACGTKTVKFVDRTFNADRRRALEILVFIASESGRSFPADVSFHFELSGDLIDDEMIRFMQTVPPGLFQFEIGIQSFYPDTIRAIHRKTDSETLKRRIRQLVAVGNAHIHTDLIAGLPYEGYEDFKNSFDVAYALGADMLQLGFLKILHGTELEMRAGEYGLVFADTPPYAVHETPWLSRNDFEKLKIVETAVDRLHNSGRFRRTLALCISRFPRAFDFFAEAGVAICDQKSLDALTDSLYHFLCEQLPDMAEEIRDVMVCDRLATNSSKTLPRSLYRADPDILSVRKHLNADTKTAEKSQVRRSIALLYHSRQAVYVDYVHKNHRGEHMLNLISLEKIK